ncbi:hypothetical protein ABT095_19075 [Kitasatospora sp. NPDC002227]|uniref:hypothetical protein n=1 Tax=Kitasatospora sp. NPDC002227 TaxID=3154773 RepID=UPI003333E038
MTTPAERSALTPPTALHDHAARLLRESPGGLPPRRGFDLPEQPDEPDREPFDRREVMAAALAALSPLPDTPAALQARFEQLGVRRHHLQLIRLAVEEMPRPPEPLGMVRELARQLVRTGRTAPVVATGITLLRRLGEPEDVPYLAVLGQFRALTRLAVHALDTLDRRAAALLWLTVGSHPDGLHPLVQALRADDGSAVRTELLALPSVRRTVFSSTARRIAEASGLADLLDLAPSDTDLLALAGRLLARMGCSQGDPDDLLPYREAVRLYGTVVTRAHLLPPTLDSTAMLLSLALDLDSGIAALLPWPPGRRATLLRELGRLLAEPLRSAAGATATEPDQRRRADWIRRTGHRPFELRSGTDEFRIDVVAGDPADQRTVETRILIGGRPVVPAWFGDGQAHRPEYLLDRGLLRAGEEPREVQLAEASCTEGCCGALYVTIRRDGEQVVWEHWRRTMPHPGAPTNLPPAHRFDAAAYDAELARAEQDASWCWPARTVARLIEAQLIDRPELLSRWDARRGWISTGHDHPDTAVVTFLYAPGLAGSVLDFLQFSWVIPDDGTPPELQAEAALRRLGEEDPKRYAQLVGGSRARAEELGYTWPDNR